MVSTGWTIHRKSGENITPDALTADWPTATRGQTMTMRYWFDADDTEEILYVPAGSSETIASGETVTRQEAIIDGTLTVDGTLNITSDGLWTLLQFLDYANAAAYGLSVDSVPWYRDQLPGRADVSSLVLGFEPDESLIDRTISGLWGLVVGGRDLRNSAITNWQLELEVFVLGEWLDYADHSEIENDLQA